MNEFVAIEDISHVSQEEILEAAQLFFSTMDVDTISKRLEASNTLDNVYVKSVIQEEELS